MELILWRHADAEDGLPDLSRRLTPRGIKQAERMAAWLLQRLPGKFHVIVFEVGKRKKNQSSSIRFTLCV